MNFHVISLFPEVVDAYTQASILGRAQKEGIFSVKSYQLRDFVTNKWGKVDERPYGGGPGMVLQAEPFVRAVEFVARNLKPKSKKLKAKILITDAGGKQLTNTYARTLAKQDDVIILCGRYEGIDARVKKMLAMKGGLIKDVKISVEEVSIGPYILTGGEVPALAIIDTTARQIPGVLGKFGSLEESRVASHEIYTRPEIIEHAGKKFRVPKVLLSGHHANVDAYREKKRSGMHQSS